jgi:hypothetical protein
MTGGATGAAGLLLIGALLIIGGHIVFGLVLGEFTYNVIYVVAAMWLVISVVAKGDWGFSGVRAQRVLGFSLAAVGALLLLADFRFGFPNGLIDLLANFGFYAACVLCFVGAWGLRD